ncbi:MAG: hypothetical protein HRU11_14885 [Parvularculaceae bacterium]|nr:hypothetical protein [Parvularculaceae bacterium]
MQQRNEFDKRIQELIRSGDGNEAYRLMTTRWASLDLSASDREDRNDRRIMIMTFRDLAEIDDRAGVFLNSITQDAVGRYVALGRNVDFQLAMDVAGQVHDSDALLELFQQAHVNGNKQHQNKGWFFFATMARAPNADIMIDLVPDLPARAESWAQAANRQLEIQRTSPNYRAVESVTRSQRQTALWRARGLDDMADAYDRRGDFDTAATLRRNARTMREAFEQL